MRTWPEAGNFARHQPEVKFVKSHFDGSLTTRPLWRCRLSWKAYWRQVNLEVS